MEKKKRRQAILSLLSQSNDFITVEAIADHVGVSVRTIHYELKEIERENTEIEMIRKRGVGVRVIWHDIPQKTAHSHHSIEVLNALGKALIVDQEVLTFESMERDFYVSRTSIQKYLDDLKKNVLQNTGASLFADHQGTRLVGDEFEIQKAMINFNALITESLIPGFSLTDYATALEALYPKHIVDTCLMMVQQFSQFGLRSAAPHYEQNILSVLITMVVRLEKGHHIHQLNSILKLDELLAMKHYLIAMDLFERMSSQIRFTFEDNDILALSIYLQSNRLEFVATRSDIDSEYIRNITHALIHKMSESTNIDLNDDQELFDNLSVHIFHMLVRIQNGVVIKNPLVDQIKRDFRLMFDLVWLAVENELPDYASKITEDELGFLMLHFQSALDRIEATKRILVVCSNGVVASSFIVNRIRQALRPLDVIELASVDKIKNHVIENVDLIISTQVLPEIDKKVVLVSPLVTDQDIANINKAYPLRHVAQAQDLHSNHLLQYLNHDFIYTDMDYKNQEDIINRVCKDLVSKGYVTEDYCESVFERETKGGTELLSNAAVPHGRMEAVNKTCIVIWVNRTPVMWNTHEVHVVIFCVIAPQDLRLSRDILKGVFKLVKTKKDTQKLLNKTRKELETYLLERYYDY